MRIAGVVVDPVSRRPVPGVEITVNHPAGLGVYERHSTDAHGRFDFLMNPTDENHLYLYDPQGDASAARHLDRSELSDHMRLTLHRSGEEMP